MRHNRSYKSSLQLNYCKLLDAVRSSSAVSQEIIILADRKCCEHIWNNIVKIYARFGTRIPVEQQEIERTGQLRYQLQIKMRFTDKFFNLKKTRYKYTYLYDIFHIFFCVENFNFIPKCGISSYRIYLC